MPLPSKHRLQVPPSAAKYNRRGKTFKEVFAAYILEPAQRVSESPVLYAKGNLNAAKYDGLAICIKLIPHTEKKLQVVAFRCLNRIGPIVHKLHLCHRIYLTDCCGHTRTIATSLIQERNQKTVFIVVCFVQFPPHLIAGVKHLPATISPPSSEYAQYPLPPCAEQVFNLLTILLVQPSNTHSGAPPPCLTQRVLRLEVVVQPATEHAFFFFLPPCLVQ